MLLVLSLGITDASGVTDVAATVIHLAVGAGTLVIETADPEINIQVNGEDVTIQGGAWGN